VATSRGEPDIARRFVVRHLALHPTALSQFQIGLRTAADGVRVSPANDSLSLGRSAVALGLFGPDDFPAEPVAPGRRTLWQRLRRAP
jgi:hypothetical protein